MASEGIVSQERDRRESLWRRLLLYGTPPRVAPDILKAGGIIRGQQGVYRDIEHTRDLTSDGAGVAMAIRHTGSTYADDLSEDGLIYHYPATARRGGRDLAEIMSLRACQGLGLPLFVIITPSDTPQLREVRRGWVYALDDDLSEALITFDEHAEEEAPGTPGHEGAFVLKAARKRGRSSSSTRPSQWKFRRQVRARYGRTCAACCIDHPKLVQAAHLCAVSDGGSDDPRNGLLLCLNHHRALDAGLLLIDPSSGEFMSGSGELSLKDLGVASPSLAHLPHQPHQEALNWLWNQHQGERGSA